MTRLRLRNLLTVTADQTSPASNIHYLTTAQSGFSDFESIVILVTILGAAGGTLDIVVEHSPDGTDWYEYYRVTTATASAAAKSYVYSPPALSTNTLDTNIEVGKNLTTTFVLASGKGCGGRPFDNMRVRYVAGTSTSAGAAQSVKILGTPRAN